MDGMEQMDWSIELADDIRGTDVGAAWREETEGEEGSLEGDETDTGAGSASGIRIGKIPKIEVGDVNPQKGEE